MRASVSDRETSRSRGAGQHAVSLTTGSAERAGLEARSEHAGARQSDEAGISPCGLHFPRSHRIRVAPLKIGNHALAYLFAKSLARLLQGPAEIATFGIPELGLEPAHTPWFEEQRQPADVDNAYPWPVPQSLLSVVKARIEARLRRSHQMQGRSPSGLDGSRARFAICTNVPNLYPVRAYSISKSLLIDIEGAVCNLGYLPSLAEARLLLPGREEWRERARAFHAGFERSPLIVHIRAGDILDEHNKLYHTIPTELIRRAAKYVDRDIVFIGQLEDSPFSQELRQAFPTATFALTGSAALDFAIIRQSRFLLLSTSTFAWLAAWLSETSGCIMLPKTGLYSPEAAPEINLIDCSDQRFQFISS